MRTFKLGKPNIPTGLRMARPNTSRLFLRNLTTSTSILEPTTTMVMTLCGQSGYSTIIVLDNTVEVDTVAADYIETFNRSLVMRSALLPVRVGIHQS
jgi:hypothetical protein